MEIKKNKLTKEEKAKIGLACGIKDLLLYETEHPPLLPDFPFYILNFIDYKNKRFVLLTYADTNNWFIYPANKLKFPK